MVYEAWSLYIGIGTGAVASLGCWMWHRRQKALKALHAVQCYEIGEDLLSAVKDRVGESFPYVALYGQVVVTGGEPVHSAYKADALGVIQQCVVREHIAKWNSATRAWHDMFNEISTQVNWRPFSLAGSKDPSVRTAILEPLSASGLYLETIYDKFEPSSESFGQNVLAFAAGEKLKGIQTTEKMLLLGTQLLAIGELSYKDGTLSLRPPGGGLPYYLTRSTLKSIVDGSSQSLVGWKVFTVLFAICSATCLTYVAYRYVDKYMQARRGRQMMDKLRAEIQGGDDDRLCVICCEEPRDVVILTCGHVSVCAKCAANLSTCPICRHNIDRLVPIYRS